VLDAAWFTFRVAMAGLLLGGAVGFGLGMLMDRFTIAERGLLPYVVLSQTVPLIALAPLVVGWGGRLHIGALTWRPWMSVSVIAAYLAFFPIAVGSLRGLRSPSAHSLELMRSFSASWWQSFRRLKLPASVPYLIPALGWPRPRRWLVRSSRRSPPASAAGSVGSSSSTRGRPPRTRPKVWTAFLGAALLGLLVAGLVALVDPALSRYRRPERSGDRGPVELAGVGKTFRGRTEVTGAQPTSTSRSRPASSSPSSGRPAAGSHAAAADRGPHRAEPRQPSP
jgi:NitT/TauT family transport system permease protein